MQRERQRSGASLIRDRHGLERSRVCSASSLRYASCCAAPDARSINLRVYEIAAGAIFIVSD
jgi:hypothetical protein